MSLHLKRRIEKLMDKGLKGLDPVLCWLSRRIQPLQDRDHLLHQYTEKTNDSMRVCMVDLPFQLLESRLKAMTKLRSKEDKKHGWNASLEMYTKGCFPLVSLYLTVIFIGGR
jgi:hypothetical protein